MNIILKTSSSMTEIGIIEISTTEISTIGNKAECRGGINGKLNTLFVNDQGNDYL